MANIQISITLDFKKFIKEFEEFTTLFHELLSVMDLLAQHADLPDADLIRMRATNVYAGCMEFLESLKSE